MKKKNNMRSRIFALFLALVMAMTMSAPVFAVDDAESVEQDSVQLTEEEKAEVEEQIEQAEKTEQTVNDEKQDQEGDTVKEESDKSAVSATESTVRSATASDEQSWTLSVTEDARSGAVTLTWSKYDQTDYYRASYKKASDPEYTKVSESSALSTVVKNLTRGTDYTFKVEAFRNEETDPIATVTIDYKTYAILYTADSRRAVSNGNTASGMWNLNLREVLGEGNGGYAVAQGAATDGKYAYWMMASSDNQKGRIVKTDLAGNVVAKGPVVGIHHANGMTYNSKYNLLVCVGYSSWRQELTYINPNTLTYANTGTLTYPYDIKGMTAGHKQNGIAAIAYIPRYDVYVARSRGSVDSSGSNDIFVFSGEANPKCIGYIKTNVSAYPETYQSMAADEKYVYYLISPGSGQPGNRILCLDWHSDKIIPAVNKIKGYGKSDAKPYYEETWYAGTDGSPTAVKDIPIPFETEGLLFVPVENGKAGHFYVSQYYGRQHYKTVTQKVVASKKKVKKVKMWWHKKKKKWVTKKPKKKYRGKSKKKWKYKYTYKYVTDKKADYWARDDYVWDLGIF